jgi:hypothetical protein
MEAQAAQALTQIAVELGMSISNNNQNWWNYE